MSAKDCTTGCSPVLLSFKSVCRPNIKKTIFWRRYKAQVKGIYYNQEAIKIGQCNEQDK